MTPVLDLVVTGLSLGGAALAGVRWLRVAQREHYLPGSVSRFALRWWSLGPNIVVAVAMVVALVATPVVPTAGVVVALGAALGPFGLGLRGTRPGPLRWTRRLRTLSAVSGALAIVIIGSGFLVGPATAVCLAAVVAVFVPALVDGAAAVCVPIERASGAHFVEQATRKLAQIRPEVVGITGSYGKTTTKGYLAHLLAGTRTVVPTPASFNNRAGLARAVNEHLLPGTDVFIAEMGTYGRGEIADLCEWVRPRLAAVTAIGPVHLERMKNEDVIVEAKAEIFATAEVCVLNADDVRLATLAHRLEAAGKDVVRVSAHDIAADVTVVADDAGSSPATGVTLWVKGEEVGHVDAVTAPPTNVAVAVALALRLGVPVPTAFDRLSSLPVAAHRLSTSTGTKGFTILDDTYNANPAGSREALRSLVRHGRPGGRRVVVTPGMVELGHRQAGENTDLAATAVGVATTLVIVGRTNRRALAEGAARGPAGCEVVVVDGHDQAVAWVTDHCGPGDVVLYENMLPDHFA